MSRGCLVCDELGGEVGVPGGFLTQDEVVASFHAVPLPERGNPRPYLGHLMVVTRRHVPRLGDLNPQESARVGQVAARLAHALTEVGGAEWVYSAVIGTAVPHFHQHLLPRYPGTPREVPWHSVDEWEGGRRGGAAEIAELAGRLKRWLDGRPG
jgi:diadenosine tetraphosphate (Ap4A) HIT family hydrolase